MRALDLLSEHAEVPSAPSAARRLLFRDSLRSEAPGEVLQWWERRRLSFNLAVGATGLVSIGALRVLSALPPFAHDLSGPPLLAIVAYGVAANVAYTSGWILELALLRPLFGRHSGTVGATLFRYGLAFSVGLTAIPAVAAVVEFKLRLLRWVLGTG